MNKNFQIYFVSLNKGIKAADSVFYLKLESRVAFPNMTGSSTQTASNLCYKYFNA
jgi:hypothetical protein